MLSSAAQRQRRGIRSADSIAGFLSNFRHSFPFSQALMPRVRLFRRNFGPRKVGSAAKFGIQRAVWRSSPGTGANPRKVLNSGPGSGRLAAPC